MKLLITGSRTWTDRYSIARHIERHATDAFALGDTVLVIHGDASGADRLARDVVRSHRADGWPIDEHAEPAKWAECVPTCKPTHRKVNRAGGEYCPTAGHRRNAEMVALGADVCLAFIRHDSPGATACADLAEAAGIPTVRVRWEDRDNPTTDPEPN